jgi:hypothetical protein
MAQSLDYKMSDAWQVDGSTPHYLLAAKAALSFLEYVLTRFRAVVRRKIDS